MAKKINITAQLNAATTDGILADAGQIFDTKKGKFQEQVNEELEDAVKDIGVSFGNPSEVEVEVEKVDGTSSSVSIPAATTMAAGVMSAEDKVKLDESVAVANKASKDVAAQKATIDSLEEQLANIGDVGVASAAKDVTFTTGTSGLTQVNVQGALTELAGKVSSTVKDVRVRWNENGEVVIDSEEEGGDINSATIPAASQSADGVMSKEDKKKLDEIAESIVQEPGDSETLVMSQKAITDLYNKGYRFLGVATPESIPETIESYHKIYYIATTPGTYTNFNDLIVEDDEIAFLTYNGVWSKNAISGIVTESRFKVVNDRFGIVDKRMWRNGYFDPENGTSITGSKNTILNTEYIKVSANTLYYIYGIGDFGTTIYFYDKDKNFINYNKWFPSIQKFSTVGNAEYVRIALRNLSGELPAETFQEDVYLQKITWQGSNTFYPKKLSIIGDSISTFNKDGYKIDGYGMKYPWEDVSEVDETYWKQLLNISSGTLEINASYSGSCVSNNRQSGGYPSLCDRIPLIGNPDTILIALGTNDSRDNVTMGDYKFDATVDELTENTFREAYIKGIKLLQASYPNANIVLLALRMADRYRESISDIARYYKLKFVSINDYESPDDIHPNNVGMKQIAGALAKVDIYTLENNNYQPGFDGSYTTSNIDNIKTPGVYVRKEGSSTRGQILLVSKSSDGSIIYQHQQYIGNDGSLFFDARKFENGSWSVWNLLDEMLALPVLSNSVPIDITNDNITLSNVYLYYESRRISISGTVELTEKVQVSKVVYNIDTQVMHNAQAGGGLKYNEVVLAYIYRNAETLDVERVSIGTPNYTINGVDVTKIDLSSINQEISSINQEISSINQEISSIKQDVDSLNLGAYKLFEADYKVSDVVNQIVNGVASSSTVNTRRVYYIPVSRGERITFKGGNNNSSKLVEWALYAEEPSVSSSAIIHGNSSEVGEDISISVQIPQDGYIALAINGSYHKDWKVYKALTYAESPVGSGGDTFYNPSKVKYICHRGVRNSEIPENTTYSVMKAAMYGIKYVECDVRYTSDGIGVVMHDTTINRTMCNPDQTNIASSIAVSDYTYESLSQYVYKSSNPAFRSKIQTIREYIDACAYWDSCPIIQGALSSEDLQYCLKRLGDNWICYGGNWRELRKYSDSVLYLTPGTYDSVDSMLEFFQSVGGKVGISRLFNTELTDEIISACRENHFEIMASYAYDKANIPDAIRRGATIVLSDNVGREIHKVLASSDEGWEKFGHEGSGEIHINVGNELNYTINSKGLYKVFCEYEGEGVFTLPSYGDSGNFINTDFNMSGNVFQYNFLYLEDGSYTMSVKPSSNMVLKRLVIFYEES